MSDEETGPLERGQLRDEAAKWFAIMRGPEAKARREEFDGWLARGALHRDAYNRIGETFGLGKLLKDDQHGVQGEPKHVRTSQIATLAGAVLIVVAGALGIQSWRTMELLPTAGVVSAANDEGPPAPSHILSTRLGEIRRVSLGDGTIITLDTDSLLTASYSRALRFLRLERGRARVEPGDDRRPMEVHVENGVVSGRGKIFDVRLGQDGVVSIHVINGTFAVSNAARPGRRASAFVPVVAGKTIRLSSFGFLRSSGSTIKDVETWPSGLIDFDQTPLSAVVAEANRYSSVQIVLADPDLASIKMSGTFRINDTAKLAQRLSDLLNLSLRRTPTEELVLRHK